MNEKKVFRIEEYVTGLSPELLESIKKARSAWEENDGQRLSDEWERKRKKSRIEFLYKISGLDLTDRDKTFENFEVNSHNRKAHFLIEEYIASWHSVGDSGVVIMGNLGVGKTHLCLAMMNELISKHLVGCEYANVRVTLDEMKNSFDGVVINPVLRLKRRELVIFDDLGSERPTEWTLDAISSLVIWRYEHHLPTVFTTNARTWDELVEMLAGNFGRFRTERLVERILERNEAVSISGRSWRKPLERVFGSTVR